MVNLVKCIKYTAPQKTFQFFSTSMIYYVLVHFCYLLLFLLGFNRMINNCRWSKAAWAATRCRPLRCRPTTPPAASSRRAAQGASPAKHTAQAVPEKWRRHAQSSSEKRSFPCFLCLQHRRRKLQVCCKTVLKAEFLNTELNLNLQTVPLSTCPMQKVTYTAEWVVSIKSSQTLRFREKTKKCKIFNRKIHRTSCLKTTQIYMSTWLASHCLLTSQFCHNLPAI